MTFISKYNLFVKVKIWDGIANDFFDRNVPHPAVAGWAGAGSFTFAGMGDAILMAGARKGNL
jgi:hypothetical protein